MESPVRRCKGGLHSGTRQGAGQARYERGREVGENNPQTIWGGAGHNDGPCQANLVTTGTEDENAGSDTSTSSQDDEALIQLLKSYKASRKNVSRFVGMVKTTADTRILHVNVDPRCVRSLLARLLADISVALMDGGCDTGLLDGRSWHIVCYTGRFANVVGFDELIAKKSGLPIVVGITKCALPNRMGHILPV